MPPKFSLVTLLLEGFLEVDDYIRYRGNKVMLQLGAMLDKCVQRTEIEY
jgi:hypothetical protein